MNPQKVSALANYANAVNECGRRLAFGLSIWLYAMGLCHLANENATATATGSLQMRRRSCLEKVVFAQFANDVFLSTSNGERAKTNGNKRQRLPARYYFCQPGVDLAKTMKIPQAR